MTSDFPYHYRRNLRPKFYSMKTYRLGIEFSLFIRWMVIKNSSCKNAKLSLLMPPVWFLSLYCQSKVFLLQWLLKPNVLCVYNPAMYWWRTPHLINILFYGSLNVTGSRVSDFYTCHPSTFPVAITLRSQALMLISTTHEEGTSRHLMAGWKTDIIITHMAP